MRNVVIVEACRTAIGNMGGSLKPLSAEDLAVNVINGVMDRSGLSKDIVEEVVMGQCRQSSDSSDIARVAALRAGIPESAPGYTVMIACASGMMATSNGAADIALGNIDSAIVGGTESMSNAIFYMSNARYGVGTGTTQFKDSLTEAQFNSQPNDIYGHFNMGMTAENIAKRMGISRLEQDEFAYQSQLKARDAISGGKFKDEIIPVTVPQGRKKDPIIFDTDEFPKDTNMEKLAKLKPAFDPEGTVTAGSSSGRNDGAAAMLIMAEEKAMELGLKPLARIKGIAAAGVDPRYMGLGPVPATHKVLKKTGLTLNDIQLIELNEAFAAQSIGCIRELGLDKSILNVNGGAIALGHPIGCSGARIIITLMNEMRKRELNLGLATLCVAGGMGMATVIEAVY